MIALAIAVAGLFAACLIAGAVGAVVFLILAAIATDRRMDRIDARRGDDL